MDEPPLSSHAPLFLYVAPTDTWGILQSGGADRVNGTRTF